MRVIAPLALSLLAGGLGRPAAGSDAPNPAVAALLADGHYKEAYTAALPQPDQADPAALAAVARSFLAASLQGQDIYERWFALRALRDVPDAELAVTVRPLATNEDRYVQSLALECLANGDAVAARDVFITALASPHHTIRLRALRGLTVHMDAAALQPVLGVLRDDPDPELRAMAARVLGESGLQAAIPALQDAIDDASPLVQTEAVRALVALRAPGTSDRLRRRLADANRDQRLQVVGLLALARDPGLASALAPLMASDDAELRTAAAAAVLAVQLPPDGKRR